MAKFNATPHLILIAQAINAERASADAKVVDGVLHIEGKSMQFSYDFDEQRDRISAWRTEPNGKFYLRIHGWSWRSRGGYSQPTKTLPVRKDGTMNYAEAASMLLMRFSHDRHVEDKRSVEESNKEMAEALRQELGYSAGLGWISPCNIYKGHVTIEVKRSVTPEQARAIAEILKAK